MKLYPVTLILGALLDIILIWACRMGSKVEIRTEIMAL
jgi:hypothetical protein